MSDLSWSREMADRLARAVKDRLGTHEQASVASGVPKPTISKILAYSTEPKASTLAAIAAAAGVSVDYVLTGSGVVDAFMEPIREQPTTGDTLSEGPAQLAKRSKFSSVDDPDLVQVQEIDLRFGLGATDLEMPVTSEVQTFSRSWLRRYTRARPEKVYFAQGVGDSMAPTIHDSDLVLIDTSEQTVRVADKIWAVAYSGSGMVKRLRQTPNGVRIMSDNPAVPDEIAYDGELHVLGRVVGIFRKM